MITIRMVAFASVAAPLVLLGGCQAAQDLTTVSDARTAVSKTATAVTTIGLSSASTLTKARAAACAGQALANTVTDMLTSTGHTAAAANSAAVSTALGSGCSWTLPAL